MLLVLEAKAGAANAAPPVMPARRSSEPAALAMATDIVHDGRESIVHVGGATLQPPKQQATARWEEQGGVGK